MKLFSYLLALCFFITQSLQAAGEPLRVAVDPINPPFVMQGANNQLYGYDISMMENICKILQRTCQFIPIRFNKILNAVDTNQVDVGCSSITITADRVKIVDFSLPYLVSPARIIGPKNLAKSFNIHLLDGKKIGMTEGSIYAVLLQQMGIKNPKIIPYTDLNYLIDDLYQGKINFGLMDEPSALFWQTQSSQKLAVLGKSINYGAGLGIAVNRDNPVLLRAINDALLIYLDSNDFNTNYHTYMTHF
ncbi:transporter substrate-binding domain-containing protein [uncultured Legionella sp.]|uniref:transporter substrate-binding domain-containing protein n=1 Tax=uncultured Legionella sp. TaxID=210934 RepID=UPI00262631DA|nr:transporter substrate-binding domain-containing protein [uncultured Legionella sp.]